MTNFLRQHLLFPFFLQTVTIFHHRRQSFTGLHHHHAISPIHSISVSPHGSARSNQILKQTTQKRTYMCSPTNHPGLFQCSLPKGFGLHSLSSFSIPYLQNRLNARKSALTNSLVRIGGIEGHDGKNLR